MYKNLNTAALGVSGTQNEIIELALSYGFKGLDLNLAEVHQQVQARGLPGARRLLDSAKLKLGSFALPMDWQQEAGFAAELGRFQPFAELAAELDCRRATVLLDPASDDRPYHQNFEFHRRRLGELGIALNRHGLMLGVGIQAAPALRTDRPYEFVHGVDALFMLVGMVGQPNVGLAIDLWDWHVAGADAEAIRKLKGEQVVSVAVADAPADMDHESADESQRLLPGEAGTIDVAAALAVLAEIGYDGPVTPRPHPSRFKGQKRDAIVKQAGAALDAAWKAAAIGTVPVKAAV